MTMMRFSGILSLIIILASCSKDKYTSEPQIEFKSLSPNTYKAGSTVFVQGPILRIQLRDAEGDFGFNDNSDTSYVFIKNITIPPFNEDSLKFPSSNGIKRKNFNAEIAVDLKSGSGLLASSGKPVDTVFFEVFVKDFAKHKSNVIQTSTPLYIVQ